MLWESYYYYLYFINEWTEIGSLAPKALSYYAIIFVKILQKTIIKFFLIETLSLLKIKLFQKMNS